MNKYEVKNVERIEFFLNRGVPMVKLIIDNLTALEMGEIGIGDYDLSFNQDGVRFAGGVFVTRIDIFYRSSVEFATDKERYLALYLSGRGHKDD